MIIRIFLKKKNMSKNLFCFYTTTIYMFLLLYYYYILIFFLLFLLLFINPFITIALLFFNLLLLDFVARCIVGLVGDLEFGEGNGMWGLG